MVAEAAGNLLVADGAIGPTGMHGCEQNELWGMFTEIQRFPGCMAEKEYRFSCFLSSSETLNSFYLFTLFEFALARTNVSRGADGRLGFCRSGPKWQNGAIEKFFQFGRKLVHGIPLSYLDAQVEIVQRKCQPCP